MPTRLAACSCGQLSARVLGDPVRVSICHCLACQRRTGSVFGVQARFPENAVRVEGTTSEWIRKVDDGDEVLFRFCPVCASTVCWRIRSLEGFVAVAVGAFADPAFPAPTVSIWEQERHRAFPLPELDHYD